MAGALAPARRPFLWDARRRAPQATNPSDRAYGQGPAGETRASLLFGFAPGGACRAADVAAGAVRSYRTLSPLPGWTFNGRVRAVCFLWRFPWGRPRRTLSGAASVWSPDFPPLREKRRPSGRLAQKGI